MLLLIANETQASCPAVVQHPPCAEFGRADAVFIATANKVETQSGNFAGITPPSTVQFTIAESFKGIEGSQLVLEQDSCGHEFKEGENYLVYAHRNQNNGKLFVRLGSTRTRLFSEAAEDLEYIRSWRRGDVQANIVGKVGQKTADIKKIFGSSFSSDRFFFGTPMSGVKVFAKNAERTFETFSDATGNYRFFSLPAGEYEVWADYPIYFVSEKLKVQTPANGCGIANFQGHRKGSITGRVADDGGAAISGIRLSLVSADASLEEIYEDRKIESAWLLAETDEKGGYFFSNLPAGRYYVVINRTDYERRLSEKFRKTPRLFYPNAANLKEATIISIEEGEQITAKDFRLPKSN
jgi:hypothetical protein